MLPPAAQQVNNNGQNQISEDVEVLMMALIMITVIMMPLMIIQLPEDPTIPLLVRPSQKTSEGDISRTESGIIDPLVSKQPEKHCQRHNGPRV